MDADNEPSGLLPTIADLELWAAAGDAKAQNMLAMFAMLDEAVDVCTDPQCPDQEFWHDAHDQDDQVFWHDVHDQEADK